MDVHAAGVVYRAGNKVLLLRRGDEPKDYPNVWAFPAGHIEEGETAEQAAYREFEEETGQRAPDGKLIGASQGCALFLSRGEAFTPNLNEESEGYMWARLDALPEPLLPGVEETLKMAYSMDKALSTVAQAADRWAEDKKASARLLDTNGWYEIKNNPLSKTGIFEYAGHQLPGAPDPDKLYRVYRPAEELESEDTINSFKLIPWVDDHMMLGNEDEDESLTPAEKKGVQGVVGEDVHFDGTHLRGNIKIFSEAMKNLIEAGKRELSAGYRCTYDWTPGEVDGQSYDLVQRNIRGNHLALVKEGRMGPDVAVLDHYSFTLDAKDIDMAEEEKEGGSNMTVEEAKELLKQIVPLVKDIQALFGDDEPDGDEGVEVEGDEDTEAPPDVEAESRSEESEDEEEVKIEEKPMMKEGEKKEDKGMDAKEITDHVMDQFNRREKLYSKLSPVIGAFDHSTMTEKTMAEYGCKKLGLNYPESARVVALNAHLDALASVPVREHAAQDSNEGGFVDAYLEGK